MRTSVFLVTLVLTAVPSRGILETDPEPLKVYAISRTGVQPPSSKSERKALGKELKNKKKEAERARKELEKQLTKQYGKKREQ